MFSEKVGCIEIGDNVFIGAGTSINYNVRIGSNVIIGACSLITKDVPDNVVVVGVPAKVIGSFDDYLQKRLADNNNGKLGAESVYEESETDWWRNFYNAREGQK